MAAKQPTWASCDHNGCIGSRVADTSWCLAHAAEQTLDDELKRIGTEGTIDARGVPINNELLGRILAGAPRENGQPKLTTVQFDQAIFRDPARFDGVTFQGEASFSGATFETLASFYWVTFEADVSFFGATFQQTVGFNQATFQGEASFHRATFRTHAVFDAATFHGKASFEAATFLLPRFDWVTFNGWADFDKAIFRGVPLFEGVTFQGEASFSGATFQDRAAFDRITFHGKAWFDEATFQSRANFQEVTFQHRAAFGRATFEAADFDGATFQDTADFVGATFPGEASFYGATFCGYADFSLTTFGSDTRFGRAIFKSPAHWDRTSFKGQVAYNGATFHNFATFNGAVFEQARQFGPLLVAFRLDLYDVVFHTWVQLEVVAASLRMGRTQFVGGAQIRVRWASVVLDDASLAAPSVLAGVPPFNDLDERPFTQRWARRLPDRLPAEQWRPRLLTLVRTDIAGLRIADVDLQACRFAGAHNLDKLRIEGVPQLARPPRGWHFRRVGGEGLPIWWWTSRMTLAEEQQWRATRRLRPTLSGRRHPQLRGWWSPACRPAPELPEGPPRSPVQLAALYRELRKGREDAKDEPGAADFYYGEMELRRHNTNTALGERFVLWLYWLTSGYGLRGLRALICLAVVVLTVSGLLHVIGFYPLHPATPRSFWSSLLYAAESTLSLGSANISLTGWGRTLRIVVRLTGPVMLGLALLSVRNRVKR